MDVAVNGILAQAEVLHAECASAIHLAVECQLAECDPIMVRTPDVVTALKAVGLNTLMATGDGLTTTKAVAVRLGSTECMLK